MTSDEKLSISLSKNKIQCLLELTYARAKPPHKSRHKSFWKGLIPHWPLHPILFNLKIYNKDKEETYAFGRRLFLPVSSVKLL